jgi:hypothetical protein
VVDPRCEGGVVPTHTTTIKLVGTEGERYFGVRYDILEVAFWQFLIKKEL